MKMAMFKLFFSFCLSDIARQSVFFLIAINNNPPFIQLQKKSKYLLLDFVYTFDTLHRNVLKLRVNKPFYALGWFFSTGWKVVLFKYKDYLTK